ncbi:MAG TPA: hypothetical protein VGY54_14585 [Polyangiaceae bacterium]|nr:hypothetical protein [Polyangiaceae bacterium]
MYVTRPPLQHARDLEQGDLVAILWRPLPPVAKSILPLKDDRKSFDFGKSKDGQPFQRPVELLRIECDVEVVKVALVVSNSCDNTRRAHRLLLVPTQPFSLPSGNDVEMQWRKISEAATGTATPKFFYLPQDPAFGLERSEALLVDFVSVSAEYLDRCLQFGGTRRICGMSAEAQQHLQWALGLVFGRNSRNDHDWPSDEDLALKKRALEAQIGRGCRDVEEKRAELRHVEAELQRRVRAVQAEVRQNGDVQRPPEVDLALLAQPTESGPTEPETS